MELAAAAITRSRLGGLCLCLDLLYGVRASASLKSES